MANTAANRALSDHVGISTGTGGPTTTRMHGPLEVVIDAAGFVWVYGKANATLAAGTIGYDQTTVTGQGTLKAGTGYTLDQACASGSWHFAKKAASIA